MPAEIHFGTFIAAFMAVLEYGMEDAPVTCTHTVRSVRDALGKVERELLAYLQFHHLVLAPYNAQVREVLIQAINAGLKDAMYKLAVDAAAVRRQYPLVPPPPGSGPVFQPLAFTQLRALVEEGSTNSLVVRADMWYRVHATAKGGGSGKRNTPPGANGRKSTVAKGGTGWGGVGGTPSKSRPATLGNLPTNACHYAWSGDDCPRPSCPFDHHQVSPSVCAGGAGQARNTLSLPPSAAPSPSAPAAAGLRRRGKRRSWGGREATPECRAGSRSHTGSGNGATSGAGAARGGGGN